MVQRIDAASTNAKYESKSFAQPSFNLVDNEYIKIADSAIAKTTMFFNEFNLIDGVAPTNIQDAYTKLIALTESMGAGGPPFTGQLIQDEDPVSEENPLPVKYVNPVFDFYTEDVEEDTSNNTTFVGKQTNAGVWLLQKIVEATVGTKTTTTMEYASVLNNATKTTYASAWTDRATLTYSEIKNLL